jgi:hypothetical protein
MTNGTGADRAIQVDVINSKGIAVGIEGAFLKLSTTMPPSIVSIPSVNRESRTLLTLEKFPTQQVADISSKSTVISDALARGGAAETSNKDSKRCEQTNLHDSSGFEIGRPQSLTQRGLSFLAILLGALSLPTAK